MEGPKSDDIAQAFKLARETTVTVAFSFKCFVITGKAVGIYLRL